LQAARQVKELQARYAQVRELIPMGAYVPGADARTDQAVQRWPQLEAFLRQGTAEAAVAACVAQLGEVLA
jgi:flagellum-specific ATP synthase